MTIEGFFDRNSVLNLSFFNFRNAITAAYFADTDLKILKVNGNFRSFFPVLGNVTDAYFPNVLEQLGVPQSQIDDFIADINEKGSVLIPQIQIRINNSDRVFSLLSARTNDENFSYLNGVQGQFIDRTDEWALRKEREELLGQKIKDGEIIEAKNRELERVATRLAKYLSPQIYKSMFTGSQEQARAHARKNLTILFSDIEHFTDLSDSLEPESLAHVINSYLSEMTSIAIQCGGTIDKFIGDAVLVFFGDPDSKGEQDDALNCVEMAIQMQTRVEELQKYWRKHGVTKGIRVRMGITTGHCTVGNFGSEQRLEYTVLGGPVNLAARIQAMAPAGSILIDGNTHELIIDHVACVEFDSFVPRGFVRPVQLYKVNDFLSDTHSGRRKHLSHVGDRVEVNVIDSSDIRAAIAELKIIHEEFDKRFKEDS